MRWVLGLAALALVAAPAVAQPTPAPTAAQPVPTAPPRETVTGDLAQERTSVIITTFATPEATATPAGTTAVLGRQIAEVIAADLERSGLYAPRGPAGLRAISMGEVTAPAFAG
ncbi:MAG: Tol-Pal system protein TolB, partial [Sphingopyxis sp.]